MLFTSIPNTINGKETLYIFFVSPLVLIFVFAMGGVVSADYFLIHLLVCLFIFFFGVAVTYDQLEVATKVYHLLPNSTQARANMADSHASLMVPNPKYRVHVPSVSLRIPTSTTWPATLDQDVR